MNSNKSMIYNTKSRMDEDHITIQGNRSMVYGNSLLQSISYVESPKKYLNKKEEYYSNHRQSSNHDYEQPSLSKNSSTPFQYNKKSYMQYMNPNFV